ncbi:MAG: hypothetical protein KatS3mg023_3733 [Armatimonadota bacterium]|nr:MAG: hypothetical protein KatS3mg023_3733 [Armatimonadota bacterium]
MFSDWERLYSTWEDIASADERNAASVLRIGLEAILEAMTDLYRQYDALVEDMQAAHNAMLRQISTVQTLLADTRKRMNAILKSSIVPGGKGLHVLQDICLLNGCTYNSFYDGYAPNPAFMHEPLRRSRLSHSEVVVDYATGDVTVEGDWSSLWDGSDDTAVRLIVHSPAPVSLDNSNLNVIGNYTGGAIVRLRIGFGEYIAMNQIVLETDEKVKVLGYGLESPNSINGLNVFADPNVTGTWYNAAGNYALTQYDEVVARNVLTLIPETENAFARYNAANRAIPSGYASPPYSSGIYHSSIYRLRVRCRALDAPVEATFRVFDQNDRTCITHTEVIQPGRGYFDVYARGAMPNSTQIGVSISVKRVGWNAGRLRVREVTVVDEFFQFVVNLPYSNRFAFPTYYVRPMRTMTITLGLQHAQTSPDGGIDYVCTIRRLDLRFPQYTNTAMMVAPPVRQTTHPITEVRVFVEGENLENSSIVVGSDSSFLHSVTIPASEAQSPSGVTVTFQPTLGSLPQPSGYNIPVPLQYAVEQFEYGQEFELSYVPYCSAYAVRQMLERIGKYDANLDLSEVDFDSLSEMGFSQFRSLVTTVDTNSGEWSGTLLGQNRNLQFEDNPDFVALYGTLPASGGGAEDVDLINISVRTVEGYPTVVKNGSGQPGDSWSVTGAWIYNTTESAVLPPRGAVVRGGRTYTNPFDYQALLLRGYPPGTSFSIYSNQFTMAPDRDYVIRYEIKRGDGVTGTPANFVTLFYDGNRRDLKSTWSPDELYSQELQVRLPSRSGNYNATLFLSTRDGEAPVISPIQVSPLFRYLNRTVTGDYEITEYSIPGGVVHTEYVRIYIALYGAPVISEGQRIRIPEIYVSGASGSGSRPDITMSVRPQDSDGWINLGAPTNASYSGSSDTGTFTNLEWTMPAGFGSRPVHYIAILVRRSSDTGLTMTLRMKLLGNNVGNRLELVRSVAIPDPNNVSASLSWSASSTDRVIRLSDREALSIPLVLKGFGNNSISVYVNNRAWPSDLVRINDPEYFGPASESVERRLSLLIYGQGQQFVVEDIDLVANGMLKDHPVPVALKAGRQFRKMSTFQTIVPVKVTVDTPFGLFRPDITGELPLSGNREVRDERLELASDLVLEQYEQDVVSGLISRSIRYDKPVYATRFAPIALHQNGNPRLELRIHKRSDGSLFKRLERRDYVLDHRRGLIQLLDDPGSDYYVVADYWFTVVSEAQLRAYNEQVRGDWITRNRTDYLSGTIPSLKSLRFTADEVSGYPVLEYYHNGNRLILSQEIPPPADARYAVSVAYWYLPVNPAVKVILRPGYDSTLEVNVPPVLRRLVVMT